MDRRRLARTLAHGTAAGLTGTAVMSATLSAERRARRSEALAFVDYDASPHVVVAASKIVGFMPRTDRGKRVLFLIVHWGYGSVVGVGYDAIRPLVDSDTDAAVAFLAGCQAMALTLFPTLGETPPPWRWRPDLLVSSLAQHAVYAVAVAAASRLLPA